MADQTFTPKEDESVKETRSSRGWGRWVILAGIFFVSIVEVGTTRTLSLFLGDFTYQFDTSTTYVGAIYGLATGMPYILGLVNIPLLRRFSVRQLVVAGGILASTGLIAASYSTTTPGLVCALIAYGLGYTFIVLPIDSCQIDYFPDKFEIATGINYAGASLGVMILPWIFQTLIDFYGWRGAMLLLGGLNIHVVAFGILMKPVEKTSADKVTNLKNNENIGNVNPNFENDGIDDLKVVTRNVQLDPSEIELQDLVDEPVVDDSDKDAVVENGVALQKDEHDRTGHSSCPIGTKDTGSGTLSSPRKIEAGEIVTCGNNDDYAYSSTMSTNVSNKDTYNVKLTNGRFNWICSFGKFFKEHPAMIIVCLQVFLFALTYGTWLLFTIPNAQAKGLPDQRAAQLSLAGGVTNFLGRFAYGFIASKKFARIEVWYLIFNIISAITFFVNYVAVSFWFLMILSLLFGFSFGFKSPAQLSIVMSAVGIEHFKTGVGLNYLCAGTAYSVLGFISGAIFDRTQSYNVAFCIMGAFDLLGGFLTILPVAWSRFQRNS